VCFSLRLVDCVNDECVCEPLQTGQTIEQTRGQRVVPTKSTANTTNSFNDRTQTRRQQILSQLRSANPQTLQSHDAPVC
jgi:hypothetical protein